MTWRIENHDVQATPWPLEPESVQCVVTSPPYWGLRDYGVGGQIGLERTPDEYVAKLVAVFREVRSVLRKDGTAWLNLGDCYAANRSYQVRDNKHVDVGNTMASAVPAGLKPKDLVGIPWRVAFALQADGWWLRSDVVWAKANPMPESIRDRPTRAHEYVFLLTKSARYFYDQDAIREPSNARVTNWWGDGEYPEHVDVRQKRRNGVDGTVLNASSSRAIPGGVSFNSSGANARTVWQIATEPFPEAHFATFPTELARRCILAGTSEAGACGECGAPFVRVVKDSDSYEAFKVAERERKGGGMRSSELESFGLTRGSANKSVTRQTETLGFRPSCSCQTEARKPCLVLDPFSGAGTVALVADMLGRDAVGLELNPEYVEMSRRRVDAPRSDAEAERRGREEAGQEVLFGD